jgi:hypothetical protein
MNLNNFTLSGAHFSVLVSRDIFNEDMLAIGNSDKYDQEAFAFIMKCGASAFSLSI